MDARLQRLADLLQNWAGQWFPPGRHADLARSLEKFASQVDAQGDWERALEILEANPSAAMRQSVLQEVLVGETYFFRDPQLWQSLRLEIIPALLEAKSSESSLSIWSLGCSSGEEPYGVALYLAHYFPQLINWRINIWASDISSVALERAKAGLYGERSMRLVPPELRRRWFTKVPQGWQIAAPLRQRVHWQEQNLCAADPPLLEGRQWDLILCRNVLIYLQPHLLGGTVERLGSKLNPQGWLILAPMEIPLHLPANLRLEQTKSQLLALRPSLKPKLEPSVAPLSPPLTPAPAPKALEEPSAPSPLGPPTLERAQASAQRAQRLADSGQLQEALWEAINSVDTCQTFIGGWLSLALAQGELELYEEALDSLQKALYLDPQSPCTYLYLTRILHTLHDPQYQRYQTIFFQLVQTLPDSAPLPYGWGLQVGEAKELLRTLTS